MRRRNGDEDERRGGTERREMEGGTEMRKKGWRGEETGHGLIRRSGGDFIRLRPGTSNFEDDLCIVDIGGQKSAWVA